MYIRLFTATSLFLAICYTVAAQDASPEVAEKANWIVQGGWMMVPLLGSSIVGAAFIFERAVAIRQEVIAPAGFMDKLHAILRQGSMSEAVKYCKEDASQLAKICGAIIIRGGHSRQDLQTTITDKIDHEFSNTQSRTKVLGVISGVSPLLGLMGTVLGMIKAFTIVAEQRAMGKGELLAGGISEALVTTAVGLGIAIPCYLLYHYFKAKLENIFRDMESDLIDFTIKNRDLLGDGFKEEEN